MLALKTVTNLAHLVIFKEYKNVLADVYKLLHVKRAYVILKKEFLDKGTYETHIFSYLFAVF